LEHYPIKSIRVIDISPCLFSFGPRDKDLITVEGERLTLNDIEHRILLPIWNDCRIHYALNCASLGCPNLQPGAFAAGDTDRVMEQAARACGIAGGRPELITPDTVARQIEAGTCASLNFDTPIGDRGAP
jgi:hypothetical protein